MGCRKDRQGARVASVKLSPLIEIRDSRDECIVSPPRLSLAIERSGAFGDGSHPTTRLCAAAVDHLCRTMRPESFLDVGTGNGILARIARARGARFVVGTDIDPAALAAARRNAGLDSTDVPIEFRDSPPDSWGPRFGIVVANILEAPLKSLAAPLASALAPGGRLLISGFTRLQAHGLELPYRDAGLALRQEAYLDDWALLVFARAPATEASARSG